MRKKRYFHEFHEPVRILVVDGYGMVREALVMLLSSCLKNAVIFEKRIMSIKTYSND
ncbi:MAG: hypothetical protein HPY84_08695 [Syntrophobacteraceae bacterium]|nr:hypothetical protein [Syntrophobacteraceae bacterium]